MRKTTILAAAVALAASGAAAETVKVGVVLTYSGLGAEFGQQVDRGMEIFTKLHPQAFGNHKVELIKRDSKTPDGAVAKTLVQELITRDGVHMVTGFIYSPDALASAPIVTQGKVPMIILNAGTAWITNQSPNIARVSFSMWHSGYPMGDHAATKLACKTAAVGYTDYPPGKDSLEAFTVGFKGKGGNVVDAIPMGGPGAVPDFTPFFQRVKDAKPDCFYVFVPAGNHAAAVVKTYDELGMRQAGIKLIGPADIIQDTKLQAIGDKAVGLIVAGHYAADLDNPQNKAFVAAWKQAYGAGSTPDFMASAGYDGMAAIAHVVKTLDGKIELDKAMAALKGWTFDGPRGRVMIDANTRDIVQDIKIMRVVKQGERIGVEVIDLYPQVRDPCKQLKVGRCAE
ncbi:MAG: ABC transporter substrate-binding protein [Pseudomonadota bacterium]